MTEQAEVGPGATVELKCDSLANILVYVEDMKCKLGDIEAHMSIKDNKIVKLTQEVEKQTQDIHEVMKKRDYWRFDCIALSNDNRRYLKTIHELEVENAVMTEKHARQAEIIAKLETYGDMVAKGNSVTDEAIQHHYKAKYDQLVIDNYALIKKMNSLLMMLNMLNNNVIVIVHKLLS